MSKLNRIAAMDTREIVYRVQEKFRSEAERVRHYVGTNAAPADKVFDNFKDYLVHKAGARFYFMTTGSPREQRLEIIRRTFPQWIDNSIEQAERICKHKIRLLGFGELDLGEFIDWHRDPLTGKSWPKRFWSDYDLVNDSTAGDPKVIHELNRHQHIVTLAKAYFLTGDERYSDEAVFQMDRWIEQNPLSVGINWQSSLEIAIRSISWIWTIFLLLPSQSLTDSAALRIGRSLFEQIDHIDRFPSVFSSPNTHLIGEAAALFIAGTVFQGMEQSARWQQRGADWLIREMELQVKSDGVHGELSSYYHCYTVDFYLQALTLSRQNGFQFPGWMWKRLDRMTEFLLNFARNDGTISLVGDDDGGRALPIDSSDYRSNRFDEELFWLLGEKPAESPRDTTHAFYPAGGYAIQRSGWGSQDSQVIFDCGGLGMLNGGHGHADALSIVMNIGGTEILTDPGTCVYNGAPEWRNFFRSTRAHNTVVVDELDQSLPDGTFKWRKKASCHVVRHLLNDGFEYVEAEHDGYSDAPCNVTHRRRLLHVRPGLWIMVDDLRNGLQGSSSEHTFDFYFHFPVNAEFSIQAENDSLLRLNARADSARLQLLMQTSAAVQASTMKGQTNPIQGWVSSLYGNKSPAPALRLRMQSQAPASGMFIMAPSHSGADPAQAVAMRTVAVTEGSALAFEAEHGNIKDIFVSSFQDHFIAIPGYTLRGRFFWLRQTKGRLTQVLGIDCREVRHRGEVLMREDGGKEVFCLPQTETL